MGLELHVRLIQGRWKMLKPMLLIVLLFVAYMFSMTAVLLSYIKYSPNTGDKS